MAFANDIRAIDAGLFARFASAFKGLQDVFARQAAYRATYEELSQLTDRELADLGISRGEVKVIARQAAAEL